LRGIDLIIEWNEDHEGDQKP